MATSKTLTPTNVTIQIPAFTDKPDQRVNSNCIDKEADAINALSDQIARKTLTLTYENGITVSWGYAYEKCGIVQIMVDLTGISMAAWATMKIGSVNTTFSVATYVPAMTANGEDDNVRVEIRTTGEIYLRNWNDAAISDKEIIFNAVIIK